jgi:hypothetical protein
MTDKKILEDKTKFCPYCKNNLQYWISEDYYFKGSKYYSCVVCGWKPNLLADQRTQLIQAVRKDFIQLGADIMEIRESWGERSEYCQDEIMDRIEELIEGKEKKHVNHYQNEDYSVHCDACQEGKE